MKKLVFLLLLPLTAYGSIYYPVEFEYTQTRLVDQLNVVTGSQGDPRVVLSIPVKDVRKGDVFNVSGSAEGTNDTGHNFSWVCRIVAGETIDTHGHSTTGIIADISAGGGRNITPEMHHDPAVKTGMWIADGNYDEAFLNFWCKAASSVAVSGDKATLDSSKAHFQLTRYRKGTVWGGLPDPIPTTTVTQAPGTPSPSGTAFRDTLATSVVAGDSFVQTHSVSVDFADETAVIDLTAYVRSSTVSSSATNRLIQYKIKRDGVEIGSGSVGRVLHTSSANSAPSYASLVWRGVDTPGAGTHTYTVEFSSSSSVVNVVMEQGSLLEVTK